MHSEQYNPNNLVFVTRSAHVRRWNGGGWDNLDVGVAWNSVFVLAPNDIWIGGDLGDIRRYTGSWGSSQSIDAGADEVRSIHMFSATDGFACGENTVGAGRVWRLQSGHWSVVLSPTNVCNTIWASGPNDVWVGTTNGELWHWNGSTWTNEGVFVSGSDSINGISGLDASTIWICTDNRKIHSFNGIGVAWTTQLNVGSGRYNAIRALSADKIYCVGGFTADIRFNNGISWASQTPGITDELFGVAGVSIDDPVLINTGGPSGPPPSSPGAGSGGGPGDSRALHSGRRCFTSAVGSTWTWHIQSPGDGPVPVIEDLTIGTQPAIINDVIQPGFHGSIISDGANGLIASVTPESDYWVGLIFIPWSLQFDNGIEVIVTGTICIDEGPNPGDGWLIKEQSPYLDYELTTFGKLKRDPTISTRARIRLLTRRGEWFGSPDLGSRLHTIRIMKGIVSVAQLFIVEALQPMVDDGSIAEIVFGDTIVNHEDNTTGIECELVAATGDRINLGAIPLSIAGPVEPATIAPRLLGDDQDASFVTRGLGIIGTDPIGTLIWGGGILESGGFGWLINPESDYELTALGLLRRDPTVATRCLIRLKTQRGKWVLNPDFGSRFHTITILKGSEAKAQQFAQEALQPMIDDGSILAVNVVRVVLDHDVGGMVANIEIALPGSQVTPLGDVELGPLS